MSKPLRCRSIAFGISGKHNCTRDDARGWVEEIAAGWRTGAKGRGWRDG